MKRPLTALARMLLTLELAAPAWAQTSKTIEVIVFPGGFNWPIWVAQENGFFERNNVTVKITPTPNSELQLTNLIDGKFDIAMTAIDNLIAYMEGQGEAPTTQTPDLVAVMGSDNGLLRLVSVPEVKTYADLKGKEVSVDARTTGYAFVLEKLLEKGGLNFNDVRESRRCAAAVGGAPREEACRDPAHLAIRSGRGGPRLQQARQRGRRTRALSGHRCRSAPAMGERERVADRGLYPRLSCRARLALRPRQQGRGDRHSSQELAQHGPGLAYNSYGILMDRKDGFTRDASIDLEGVQTVLALRSQYGEPQKKLMDPMKYIDLSYYEKAKPAR